MTGDFEEELPEPESTVFKMTTKEIEITIIGIKGTSNYYICSSCGKKAALVGSLFNCEFYKMKQRVMSDNKQWCARLFVQNTNTKASNPSNFRPITLESIPLKVFTCCLRNLMYSFLTANRLRKF